MDWVIGIYGMCVRDWLLWDMGLGLGFWDIGLGLGFGDISLGLFFGDIGLGLGFWDIGFGLDDLGYKCGILSFGIYV